MTKSVKIVFIGPNGYNLCNEWTVVAEHMMELNTIATDCTADIIGITRSAVHVQFSVACHS